MVWYVFITLCRICCLIEVVTKAGMTVLITLCRICFLIEVVTKAGMTVFITLYLFRQILSYFSLVWIQFYLSRASGKWVSAKTDYLLSCCNVFFLWEILKMFSHFDLIVILYIRHRVINTVIPALVTTSIKQHIRHRVINTVIPALVTTKYERICLNR
jgi:hypothetical protein